MKKLFEQGKIGRLVLKNRIAMMPINVGFTTPVQDGWFTEKGIDFYAARAKGGAGLILTTFMRLNRKLEPSIGEPVINSRLSIAWLNELAEACHHYGAKIGIQLSPGIGLNATPDPRLPHGGVVGPSAMPCIKDPNVIARELTTGEIEQLVEDYEFSARIIADAGIDCIEIHAHQGYLLDSFMTSLWNKRTDKYGGDFAGRMRLSLELIQAVKRGCGQDFPILFRYPLTHGFSGGREVEESLEIARWLEAAGVDALNVNSGCYVTYNLAQPPTTAPPGCWVDFAEMTKKVTDLPVIVSGKLGYPVLAESVLQEGKADIIGLGRPLLADPDWANKVREGRLEDVIPCTGCHEGCIKRRRLGRNIGCAVNARTGFEKELEITPAANAKTVLVIGGGPGGMEAARVAALRGHSVTIWEKNSELGGNLIPAGVPNMKEDYRLLRDYLITQVKKLGITVEFGKAAAPESIEEYNPEALIIATGAHLYVPDLKGVDKPHVISSIALLLGNKTAGNTVIIYGGGMIAVEAALHLAEQGKRVTIVQRSEKLMRSLLKGYGKSPNPNVVEFLQLLDKYKVKVLLNTKAKEITDTGMIVMDEQGKEYDLKADTIALAIGMRPNNELYEAVHDKFPEVYEVGDSVEPRIVLNAMWEGYRTALRI